MMGMGHLLGAHKVFDLKHTAEPLMSPTHKQIMIYIYII